jgi:hypothetical protein
VTFDKGNMFGFRLRFFAPPGSNLEPAQLELSLPGAPQALVMRQLPPRPDALPTDVVVFVVDADGFSSEEEARRFGQTLKQSLAVYSVRVRQGFDLGQDEITSSFARVIREQLRAEHNVNLRPTVHGLDVFDTSVHVDRIEISARGSVTRSITELPTHLATDFRHRDLPQKLELAIALYNGCAHESDSEVRFLSLVTVLEVLAPLAGRDKATRDFIDTCLGQLEGATFTDDSERESLRKALGNLKTQSIQRRCRKAVSEAGADSAFFDQIYTARSELAHAGVSTTYPELPRQPHLLDNLVQAVLLHQVEQVTTRGT